MTLRIVIVALFLPALSPAQESWDRPIEIGGEVMTDMWGVRIPREEVTLRPFVGRLDSKARRLAAFDPPLDSARTDEAGRLRLTLPLWAAVAECPFAVVSRQTHDLVRPLDRRTHKTRLPVHGGSDETVKFVDPQGAPLACVRVAAMVGVHSSSHDHGPNFGPRYEDLVVARVRTTAADGSLALPPDALVALIRRGDDAIPVIVARDTIVVPDSLEAAAAEPRLEQALRDDSRAPPDPQAIERIVRALSEGGGTIEGTVSIAGYDGAEVIAVPEEAGLDLLASHRMMTSRPRAPFAQTADGYGRDAGHFQIGHVAPGRYRLQVAAPHYAPTLTGAFEVKAGETHYAGSIPLDRGAILILKNTMGSAVLETALGDADCHFAGPHGLVDGLAAGEITVTDWNGGCVLRRDRKVMIPAGGEVIVDLSMPGTDGR